MMAGIACPDESCVSIKSNLINKARNPSGSAQFSRNGVQRCHMILNCPILPNS